MLAVSLSRVRLTCRDAGGRWVVDSNREVRVLWTLVVIILVLWLLGWMVFEVAGGLIHLLLVVALIVIVYRLVTGRRV